MSTVQELKDEVTRAQTNVVACAHNAAVSSGIGGA